MELDALLSFRDGAKRGERRPAGLDVSMVHNLALMQSFTKGIGGNMNADIEFMRELEEEYRTVSGANDRSEYKIFYGQAFQAPILTLGLNPGGVPAETSKDGVWKKDGSRASSSASYFERKENDILDCDWPENIGLRKIAASLGQRRSNPPSKP